MIIITAVITTAIISAIWMIGIAGVTYLYTKNSPSFAVKIDAPPHAEVGEEIIVTMEVRNPTDSVLTLDSIDIGSSLLDGFKVTGVSPAVPPVPGLLGGSSYCISDTLSPDETMEITFVLEAVEPGIWTGDVDFCSPSKSFVTSSTTIRVDAPGAHAKKTDSGNSDAPPFVLGIETPHTVTLDENFTLHVRVTNPTDLPLHLESIVLAGDLPRGLELQNVSPKPKEDESDEDSWSLLYSKSLLPGETLSAEFVIKPVKEGIWTGDLDFWNEFSEDLVSSSVTIRVNPPASKGTTTQD